MLYTLLIAGSLLIAVLFKYLSRPAERCPECGLKREEGNPICPCGWVFAYPEDDEPLEYGDPEDAP